MFLTNPVPFANGGQISETLWVRDVVLHKLQRPVVIHYPPEEQKHDYHVSDCLIVTLFLKRIIWIEKARAKGHTNLGLSSVAAFGSRRRGWSCIISTKQINK